MMDPVGNGPVVTGQWRAAGQAGENSAYRAAKTDISDTLDAGILNWAGAFLSVGLIAGLGVWGYQLITRDVSSVPIVRALDGPMRVLPDNPGGELQVQKGLAVNWLQASGSAEAPADRLVLAPEVALLTDADTPRSSLRPKPRSFETAVAPPFGQMQGAQNQDGTERLIVARLDQPDAAIAAGPSDPLAKALALVDQLGASATPLSGTLRDLPLGAGSQGVQTSGARPLDARSSTRAAVELALASGASSLSDLETLGLDKSVTPLATEGIVRSPRPAKRPAIRQQIPLVTLASVAPETTSSLAAAVPAGTRLVQLGAFETAEYAQVVWDNLLNSPSFRPLMLDKQRLVQEAQSGGQTFFRLRAVGFADLADARRFCAALVAEKADCIPVVAR
jgi:hypothetical protein